MKIRDLNEYVRAIIGQDLPTDLKDPDNPFFLKLMGQDTDLEEYVGNISNFAVDSSRQFIFEFLQNADDAGADTFFVFFSEGHLLLINNGFSLQSDRSDQSGELFSLLGRGKGKKNKEKEKIGEYGIGSKLLYDLLLDASLTGNTVPQIKKERLVQKVIHHCTGPILFSWKNWSSIDQLASASEESLKKGLYHDEELPLLTKIVYSYYPSMPGEQRIAENGYTINLFQWEQLQYFIDFFRRIFPVDLKHLLQKGGMMTYIPLGIGQADYLKEQVVPAVIPGITTALALLKNVKTVWINERKIIQHGFKCLELETEEPLKESFRFIYSENPANLAEELANFYKFFPVNHEVHGFKFFIHTKKFELDNSRQRIDEGNPYNQILVRSMGRRLCSFLEKLKEEGDREEYLALMKAIIVSDEGKISKELFREGLFIPLHETLSNNLPTTTSYGTCQDNIVIRDFDIDISPADTGLDDLHWLDPELTKYYDQVESKFELDRWNLLDLVQRCHELKPFQAWLASLEKPILSDFYAQLWLASEERLSSLKSLKIFLCSDRAFYSLEEIEAAKDIFLLTPKVGKIARILQKLDQKFGGEHIDWSTPFGNQLATRLEKNQVALFEKINEIVDPQKMNYDDKWLLFKNFIDNFDIPSIEDFLRYDLVIFCNRLGIPLPLSSLHLDSESIAPSGLLDYYQIADAERFFDRQHPFMMSAAEIWKQLGEDWDERIAPLLETQPNISLNTEAIYRDLSSIANLNGHNGQGFNGQKTVFSEDNTFLSGDDVFWNRNLEGLSESEFQAVRNLLKKLTNFSSFKDIGQYRAFCEGPFELTSKGYPELVERLEQDENILDISEVRLLPLLAKSGSDHLFGKFVLNKQVDGQYLLKAKDRGQYEYFSDDAELNAFLEDKDNWVLLPSELRALFHQDKELKNTDEAFTLGLINSYGSQPAFINLIRRQSDAVCSRFLHGISPVDLSSFVVDYSPSSFEFRLLKMVAEKKLHELLEGKIFVDGKPLKQVNVRDRVCLRVDDRLLSFSLASLLPEKYSGVSDVFHRLINLFDDTDIRSSPVFSSREVESWEIKNEILRHGIKIPLHVAFLVAYLLSEEGKTDQSLSEVSSLVPSGITSGSVLDTFYQYGLYKFSKCYHFVDFEPKEKVMTPDESLLISIEIIPFWVKYWVETGDSDMIQEKEAFLKKSGVRKPDHPVLTLRNTLRREEPIDPRIVEKIKDDPYFLHNTLEWAWEEFGGFSSSWRLITLKELVGNATGQETWQGHFLQLESVEEGGNECYRINKMEDDVVYYYFDHSEFLPHLLEGIQQMRAVLAFADSGYFSQEAHQNLGKSGFRQAWVNRQLVEEELGEEKEWNVPYYEKWRENEGKNYRIRLFAGKIPFEYKFCSGSECWTIGRHNDGDVGAHDLEDGIREILVNEKVAVKSSVLELLEQNKEEIFGTDKNALLALFRLAMPRREEQEILDFIQVNQISINDVEKLHKEKNGHDGNGKGNVQLDKDLNETQQELINKLVNGLDAERWQALQGNLDRMLVALDHIEDEAKPDSVVGFIGEQLMFQWLKIRNPNAEVQYVADKKREYDILLRLPDRDIEIDVKTTIKSVLKARVPLPFYIKPSQYEYVKKYEKNNYYISRLSLEDLNWDELAREFRSLEVSREKIVETVQRYFDEEQNRHKFREIQMTFRVSYDYSMADFL